MLDPLLARIDDAIAERLAMLGGDNDEEALRLEGSFIDFVESAWPSIDPAVFQSNWAVTGLAEHLEAVAGDDPNSAEGQKFSSVFEPLRSSAAPVAYEPRLRPTPLCRSTSDHRRLPSSYWPASIAASV
jgi:hypothetical protein